MVAEYTPEERLSIAIDRMIERLERCDKDDAIPLVSVGPSGIGGYCQNEITPKDFINHCAFISWVKKRFRKVK
jgi:hypothetical protein